MRKPITFVWNSDLTGLAAVPPLTMSAGVVSSMWIVAPVTVSNRGMPSSPLTKLDFSTATTVPAGNAKLAAISAGNSPLPQDRRYPVILADPPWQYRSGTEFPTRDVANHYPTMALEEICALPVSGLATGDAVLFLWVPSPKLAEATQIIAAWGFEYQTSVVWVKDKIGMGHYVRSQHELLLIASRGKMPHPLPKDRPSSVIEAPRREHSRKPDEAYELIERMYPSLPKIELFARQQREGWDAWGNQAPKLQAA